MSDDLKREIECLRRISRDQLKDRWRALHKAVPPAAFTPDLLARGIAWRLQEKALGGLSAEARRLLDGQAATQRQPTTTRVSLRVGNRLVRRWRGRTYVVEVTEGGLVFDGTRYASLSVIASTITGSHWSGPKFFGLVQ